MVDTLFTQEPTQDGSSTYKNLEFNETYHSSIGAYTEALQKHVLACKVDEIAKNRLENEALGEKPLPIRILDVCFGLAYNSGVAIEKIWEINPRQEIEIVGLESDSAIIREIPNLQVPETYKYIQKLLEPLAEQVLKVLKIEQSSLNIEIFIDDARNSVMGLQDNYFDAVFFDPFSPKTCPVLWTEEFIRAVVRKAKPGAYLSTYSSARIAKDNFLKAGCELFEGPKLNRRNGGVLARKLPESL